VGIESIEGWGAPTLQLSTRGDWERARTLSLPASVELIEGLVDELRADSPPDLAAELLWPGPPVVFVGARFELGEAARFRSCVRTLGARHGWEPAEALTALAGGLPGPPVRAELGAVNAWRSVGPLEIALDQPASAVGDAVAQRADLIASPYPLALEIIHDRPREAWWAVEVSERSPGVQRVDVERVARLLQSAR
jgi:hypothetical protein